MKFASTLCLLTLCLFAFGCNRNTPSVALVHTDKVYKDSEAGKAGIAYLEGVSTELQKQLVALQEQASSKNKMKDEDFQQALMELQQRYNAEQQQVISALHEAYQQALENSVAKYKLDAIIPNDVVLASSPAADFTDKVIEEMNSLYVPFNPVTPEAAE